MTKSISTSQIMQFDKQGYLRLPNAIDSTQLQNIDHHIAEMECTIKPIEHNSPLHRDLAIDHSIDNSPPYRLNQLYRYLPSVVLNMLQNPAILNTAKALCGEDVLPTYESLLYKYQRSDLNVIWHQDMLHDRKSRIVTCGLYLDDAEIEEGALRVIPESQHIKQNFKQTRDGGDLDSKAVPVPVSAGDVIFHDVMILHDSLPLQQQPQRRTLYIEFRSLSHLQDNARFSSAWIENRQKLMLAAQKMDEKSLSAELLYSEMPRLEPANYGQVISQSLS